MLLVAIKKRRSCIGFLLLIFCLDSKSRASEISEKEIALLVSNAEGQPIARSPAGSFVGQKETSRDGKTYYTFKGIRYAEPPGRFQPSVLKTGAEKTYFDARKHGPVCPQKNATGFTGDEDCLYLSISHPQSKDCSEESLPVIVYLHYGSFIEGSGNLYSGKYFVDECVVLVTLNYRLGALGFLATGDNVIPGNLGLKDQFVALQWVQLNIHAFRGDPKKVTVFGTSAGAACVAMLLQVPTATGLIHRAVSQSGTSLNPWSLTVDPLARAKTLSTLLECRISKPANLTYDFRDCFLRKNVRSIVDMQEKVALTGLAFAPIIESDASANALITNKSWGAFRRGDFLRVPYVLGFVEDEGIEFAHIIFKHFRQSLVVSYSLSLFWETVASLVLSLPKMDKLKRREVAKAVKEMYFDSRSRPHIDQESLVDLFTDRYFIEGIYDTAELVSNYTPTFLYVNTYKGGRSIARDKFGYTTPVIAHTDDVQYLFPSAEEFQVGTDQYQFSKDLVQLWANFARTGVPSGRLTKTSEWRPCKGAPYESVYELNVPSRHISNYHKEQRKFWKSLNLQTVGS